MDALTSYNVVVTMGNTETAIYGVPNAFQNRFNRISARVYGLFRGGYNVEMNMSMPTTSYIRCTPADECTMASGNYNWICRCSGLVDCSNEGPYHHTNASSVSLYLWPYPRPYTTNLLMHITASPLCLISGSHLIVAGIASGNTFVVRDTDYIKEENVGLGDYENVAYVSATAIHEIGHYFGVSDHYYTHYGDDRDDCIWGYNKDVEAIVDQIDICDDCRATLLSNIN